MALEEVKAKFVGKWKVDRSENFDDFLKEVGVGFPLRKIASLVKPVMEISIEDNEKVKIVMHIGIKDQVDIFSFDEEFEKEMDGNKLKAKAIWEDGKIKIENTAVDPASKIKPQTVYREIMGDELLLRYFQNMEYKMGRAADYKFVLCNRERDPNGTYTVVDNNQHVLMLDNNVR